jgi:hypothetical protein
MSSISRATLPQNFLDSVSSGMRLPTPEPQYFFAKMAMGARLTLAALDAGLPTVQQFVTMSGGGAQLPPDLNEMARAADAYPGAILAVDDFGKGMGDTIKFRRDSYGGGGFDQASRKLTTNTTISTTGQAIQMEEVPVILEQFHGPMAAGATAPAPYQIPEFDAKYRAAKEALTSVTTRYLRRDYVKWLDSVVRDQFRKSSYISYADPTTVTSSASFTAGAGHLLSLEGIMAARKAISDREWQKFGNGRFMCLVPTKFNTDMVGDVDYRELSKVHADGRNQLFGYIGSVQDVDFFECTTLKTYAAGDVIPGDGGTVASGVTVQESLLFGPGAVGVGTALPAEARWADDTNYGTLAKCIWFAMHAFECVDSRGVQRILSQ